jgi:hypothetical protein
MQEEVEEVGEEDGGDIGAIGRRGGEEGWFGCEVEPLGESASEEVEEGAAGSQYTSATQRASGGYAGANSI